VPIAAAAAAGELASADSALSGTCIQELQGRFKHTWCSCSRSGACAWQDFGRILREADKLAFLANLLLLR
jgi:hypothetical protein